MTGQRITRLSTDVRNRRNDGAWIPLRSGLFVFRLIEWNTALTALSNAILEKGKWRE